MDFQQVVSNPMLTNAMGTAAMQFGDQHMRQVTGYFGSLRHYFAVDTPYVLHKLRLLLLPLAPAHQWTREAAPDGKHLPPKSDLNAPDLYIPVMAFVTFLLVAGFGMGTNGLFTPAALGVLASSMLGWFGVEILLYYACLYALNISSVGLLDLCAFCGYKYVGMILTVLAGVIINNQAFWAVLAWTGLALSYCLIQTLRASAADAAFAASTSASAGKLLPQTNFFVALAVLQIWFMYWFAASVVFATSSNAAGTASVLNGLKALNGDQGALDDVE